MRLEQEALTQLEPEVRSYIEELEQSKNDLKESKDELEMPN